MPLPCGTTLSLQGLPKPGDALYSKPKQAMIVRMTPELLDSIGRGNGEIEFEFGGDNQGIHIGGSFFSMNVQPEGNHELYLRQPTQLRPNAPLKLHGNVLGKVVVNPKLGKAAEERVRDRTRVAEEQRTERKTILLDQPPDLGKPAGGAKKKKDPHPMFRKPVGVPAARNLSAPTGSQAGRAPSPQVRVSSIPGSAGQTRTSSPAASTSRNVVELDPSVRGRLIHYLAAHPGADDDAVMKAVLRSKLADARRDAFLKLLEEIGLNRTERGVRHWQLKSHIWKTEVRPYEYKFSTAAADAIAKNAASVFETMGLPPNHKAWDNVRKPKEESRSSTPLNPHPLTTESARPEPKRAIMKETKVTKVRAADAPRKKKANDPIPMKDESVHLPSSSKGKEKAADPPAAAETSTSGRPTVRRLPGSGFKVRASATPPTPSRADTPMGRGTSPAVPPQPKRTGPVDARQSKRSMPPPSGSADPAPPISPPTIQERKTSGSSVTTRVVTQRKVDNERSTASQALAAAKKAAREVERGQDLPASGSSVKRFAKKRAAEDDDNYSDRDVKQKKRKVADTKERDRESERDREREQEREHERERERERARERERERESEREKERKRKRESERERESDRESYRGKDKESDMESGRERTRDAPIPKKIKKESSPITVTKVKVKKESSPATFSRPANDRDTHARPPSRLSEVETARPSSSEPHRSTHSRSRRRSPVYTSSEDESSPPPKAKTEAKVKTEPKTKERPPKEKKPKYMPVFQPRAAPLPADREALEKYYRACYRKYTILNSQKTKFLLKYQDAVNEGDDEYVYVSDSDSDSPLELMDPDITAAFMADLRGVEEELMKITRQFELLVQSGDSE